MRGGIAVFASVALAPLIACGSFSEAATAASEDGGASEASTSDGAPNDAPPGADGGGGSCVSRAASFNGDVYFQVDTPTAGFDPTALTVEAWIFIPASAPSVEMHIVSHISAGDTAGWALVLVPGPNLAFFSYTGVENTLGGSSQAKVRTNGWVHVAATRNGSNAALFVDGVQGPVSNTFPAGVATDRNLRIGVDSTGGDHGFHGLIEEVRISKVVRPISNARMPMVADDDTVALWRFEDDANAIDASGNKHDGRINGTIPRVCMKQFADDTVTPP